MKKLLSLSIATVMLFDLTGEVFAQAWTIKGTQQGHSYFNTQQKEQGDKLAQEMEQQKKQQDVAASLGVSYESFKREIEDYAEDNNIKITELQIKQLYNKHIKQLSKYDSDYKTLVNIFSKKAYAEVIATLRNSYSKKTQEVQYNNKKYDRAALLHAAIHDLILKNSILSQEQKIEVIARVYDIVEKEGFYPQDRRILWFFAYNLVKNGKQYFDVSFFTLREKKIAAKQIQANAVASAMALLPSLSTDSEKGITTDAIYNLAKDVMRYDYGPIGITTAAQALLAFKTDHSLLRLETLLTEDLYRGLGTRVALYALDSLSFEEWSNRGANRGNKASGGLGQYHNAIARRFIYIDSKKNSKEVLSMAGTKGKALEVLYKSVSTDILEDIGKMIGSASNNEKVAKLADNLASKYVSDVSNKLKAREAKMHTSVIVGILATTKKRSNNLTKAAKIIYNGNWWDISEATQRDKNNIAAKYLGYSQKPYNEGKYKEFKSLCYVKKVGHFEDIALMALFIVGLVASAPRIIRGIKTFASKGMAFIKQDVKVLAKTSATETKPAAAKPATPKPSTPEPATPEPTTTVEVPPMMAEVNALSQKTAITSHLNAGDLQFQLRRYNNAIIEYKKALAIDPKNPDILNKIEGVKKYAKGRINFYENALRKNPYDIDMHFEYADLKIRLDDLDGALNSYGDILEIEPNNFRAFMDRAHVKYQLGDYVGAVSDVKKSIAINPAQKRPEFYEYAKLTMQDLSYYNKRIAHNPGNAELYFQRANANRYLRNYKSALEDLNMAIKLSPKKASYYLERAKVHYQLGNPTAAFSDCNTSIAYGTNNTEAFFLRGKLNAGYSKFKKAIDDFTRAIESFSDPREVKTEYIYQRGYTYYLDGKYSKALKDYDWTISRGKNYTLLKERAEIKFNLKDYKGCVADMDEALRLEPDGFVPRFYEEAKKKLPSQKPVVIEVNEDLNTSTWNWD